MGGTGGGPQDELQLLERVFIRLGLAETDDQLQEAVAKFLPPVLLKLTSQNEGVRKKVMELLVHINKRIKNNPQIQLPVEALLLQYQDPAATSFVINFTIIYIKMGFPRLPLHRQMELVPSVLAGIEAKPTMHQDSLLLMIMPILGELAKHSPKDPGRKRSALGLCEKPAVSKVLYSFMFDYMLLPYGSHPSLKAPESKDNKVSVPAGMSDYSWRRVSGEAPPAAETVETTKTGLVHFLGSGLLPEMEVALHLLIGAADTRHGVASAADTENRKLAGVIDWNDPELVRKLYALFLGTLVIKDRPTVKPEHKRQPSNTRIRLKLMPVLLKSREAAIQFPSCIQVTFDLLFGTSGNSNPKLKMMAVQFVHQIIFHCPEQRLSPIGAVILSALTRLVNEEKDNPKLRGSCYLAIGKLGLKLPSLVNKDMNMIQTFFDAMSTEDSDTQLFLQEALGTMAPAFRQIEPDNRKYIEAIVATYIEKEEPQVRLVAVQYASSVFPNDNVATRYTLLIGAGDRREEVAAASRKALYAALVKAAAAANDTAVSKKTTAAAEPVLPEFPAFLSFIMDKVATRLKSSYKLQVASVTLPFPVATGAEICDYTRLCLWQSAGVGPVSLEELANPQYEAPAVGRYLGQFLAAGGGAAAGVPAQLINRFLDLADRLLTAQPGLQQARALLHFVGAVPQQLAPRYEKKLDWLRGLLANTKEELRETVSLLYGLVASGLGLAEFEKAMRDLSRSWKEKSLEYQHGVMLSLANSFARRILLARTQEPEKTFSDWKLYREAMDLFISQLEATQPLMLGGSCLALAELGRCGPLPLPDRGAEEVEEEEGGVSAGGANNKLTLLNRLLAILKSDKVNMRVREKAALAVGNTCLGDPSYPHRRFLLEKCIELASEIKDFELHFSIGDTVVSCVLGPLSPAARDLWTVSEAEFQPLVAAGSGADGGGSRREDLDWFLDQLTGRLTQSDHPNVKQAGCLWLLSVVKHCVRQEALQSRLLQIQSAFMTLLGDANDLVQDAASKGIGIVYDSCSEADREKMVGNLLDTILGGRKEVNKVTEDTKVFQEGELGKNPMSGGNLSTYRELCSLATDMGQPDLVYKFMHLANYNATWNSRKGAAFGFSSIAARAGDQLAPHLPRIIPKLYRYQFDPTPRIQQSMAAIWASLVPETNKTVDRYLAPILAEIQRELTSPQWRVRESCCAALVDILRGRTLEDALETLSLLWADLFRVMDDIKESVRVAAGKAAQSLSRVSIKMCDTTGGGGAKAGEAALRAVLPPLLEKGLLSTVADVKAVAIGTLMKLTRSAGGTLLAPHLGVLIPALLEATSEMEGHQLNYISTRLGVDNSVQEKLDSARIAAARGSPTMECVTYVLQYVDRAALEQLVPRLVDIIRSSPGLLARGGAAHVVMSLIHHCPLDLQPFTGKLLSALVGGLSDRNPALRLNFATAIGHLMLTAKDSSREKLFGRLAAWYLEREDEASRAAVAYTFQAVAKYNPDVMRGMAASAMPIAFLAMHEEKTQENTDIQEVWEEVWQEGTPGSEGGIRLYLAEIMEVLPKALESGQWAVKAQAARAMGTVATKLGGTIAPATQKRLADLLVAALAGRTWAGKECILRSLSDLAVSGADQLLANPEVDLGGLVSVLLGECGKEKVSYRCVALETTGTVLQHLAQDRFSQLYHIVAPHLPLPKEESGEGSKQQPRMSGVDEEEGKEEREQELQLLYAIITSLGLAWPLNRDTQDVYLVKMLEHLDCVVGNTTRRGQLVAAECLGRLMKRWRLPADLSAAAPGGPLCQQVFRKAANILSTLLIVPRYAQLRTETLQVLGQVIKLLVESKSSSLVYLFRDEISKSLDGVIKDLASDPSTKTTARDLKTALNAIPTEEKRV